MKLPLPKLARSFAEAVGIARKETDPDRIEAAIADAREQIAAATADREAALAAYRDGLLDASPADLEKRLAERDSATVRLDRAEALHAALMQRLAMAREAQDTARRKAIFDEATAKCEAIRARLPTEYQHHALAIRGILRDLAEAEVARRRAEIEAPDFGHILSPEDVLRGGLNQPEEIISQESVELWVFDSSGAPVPADRQEHVRSGPNIPTRGQLMEKSGPYVIAGSPPTCTRRSFVRTRLREAELPGALDSLLGYVALPALHRFGDDFVTREPTRSPDTAFEHLSRDLRPDPALERPIIERLEPAPRPVGDVARIRGAA